MKADLFFREVCQVGSAYLMKFPISKTMKVSKSSKNLRIQIFFFAFRPALS